MTTMEDDEERKYVYRNEFISELAWRSGLTLEEARSVTDIILDILADRFSCNQSVAFEGFGTFEVRPTGHRVGRNPKTLETVDIPAGYRLGFRPSKELKETVSRAIQEGIRPVVKRTPIREETSDIPRRGRPRKKFVVPEGYDVSEN